MQKGIENSLSSSCMPVVLRWISGDQIQVQVLEMAVRELKPDAEPPALDSPVTWPKFDP